MQGTHAVKYKKNKPASSVRGGSMKRFIIVIGFILGFAGLTKAALKTQNLEYKDGKTILEGYLVYDDAIQEKRPGVLVVHEWKGLGDYVRGRAEQLARMGYIA